MNAAIEGATSPNARITVLRNSVEDVRQRQVLVKLDGEPVAELLFGQSMTRELSPGHHRLLVDNTWNRKSAEFDAVAGEHIEFITRNSAGGFSWFLLFTFGAGPMYVSLERLK